MREDLGDYDRVGKNMRFFDPIDPRPTKPPVPSNRRPKPPTKNKPKAKRPKSAAEPTLKQGDKPNVLFIAVDDLNDWIGCMSGHPGAKTPNLDGLAKRGVLFERAVCPAPICNPSRAAIMTGVLPSNSGIYTNRPFFRTSPKLKRITTLPQHFRNNGYTAMRGGKIFHHLGSTDPQSWDYAFPSLDTHKPAVNFPAQRNGKNAHAYKWVTDGLELADEKMDDGKVATWAIEQLDKDHAKPFFLAVGFYKPHLPWIVPKKYFDLHPIEQIQLPKVKESDRDDISKFAQNFQNNNGPQIHKRIVAEGSWKKKVQAYLAAGSFADAQIGRVLNALDKSAYAHNTIIVLWADHGWHLGEKQHWTKFTLWEESARVPFIIAGTGNQFPIERGARCPSPVGLIDIYPTLTELCGLPSNDQNDGTSIAQLLKDPNAKWERPALTTHGAGNHSLRTKRWRYTRWRTGDEELYDHDNDPMEWNNLASDPKHATLKSDLAKWLPKKNVGLKLK